MRRHAKSKCLPTLPSAFLAILFVQGSVVADILLANGTQIWKCTGGKWKFYDAFHTLLRPLPDGSEELAGALCSLCAVLCTTTFMAADVCWRVAMQQ